MRNTPLKSHQAQREVSREGSSVGSSSGGSSAQHGGSSGGGGGTSAYTESVPPAEPDAPDAPEITPNTEPTVADTPATEPSDDTGPVTYVVDETFTYDVIPQVEESPTPDPHFDTGGLVFMGPAGTGQYGEDGDYETYAEAEAREELEAATTSDTTPQETAVTSLLNSDPEPAPVVADVGSPQPTAEESTVQTYAQPQPASALTMTDNPAPAENQPAQEQSQGHGHGGSSFGAGLTEGHGQQDPGYGQERPVPADTEETLPDVPLFETAAEEETGETEEPGEETVASLEDNNEPVSRHDTYKNVFCVAEDAKEPGQSNFESTTRASKIYLSSFNKTLEHKRIENIAGSMANKALDHFRAHYNEPDIPYRKTWTENWKNFYAEIGIPREELSPLGTRVDNDELARFSARVASQIQSSSPKNCGKEQKWWREPSECQTVSLSFKNGYSIEFDNDQLMDGYNFTSDNTTVVRLVDPAGNSTELCKEN